MFSSSTPAGSAGAEHGDSVRRAKSTPGDIAL
eukprot:COSAG03_NODE_10915_length_622_cov_0.686424_1_plen_31_part_01